MFLSHGQELEHEQSICLSQMRDEQGTLPWLCGGEDTLRLQGQAAGISESGATQSLCPVGTEMEGWDENHS